MPYDVYDLNPVDFITTDAIGEPGQRVFYLQARQGLQLITLICEKEHIIALAVAIEQLLLSLAGGDADAVVEPDSALDTGMDLELPLEPHFRVAQVNLGYDQVTNRFVLIAYELLPEEDDSTPSLARFWASPAQMRAFSVQSRDVVAAGRPTCAMCGEPMDPEGHFCPRKNGHRT